jgi:hypothetical protein
MCRELASQGECAGYAGARHGTGPIQCREQQHLWNLHAAWWVRGRRGKHVGLSPAVPQGCMRPPAGTHTANSPVLWLSALRWPPTDGLLFPPNGKQHRDTQPWALHPPPPAPAGRHRALDDVGASVGGYQARGILMALSDMVLKFKAPLRSGDAFRVDTRVEQASGGGAGRRRLTPALTLQSNVPVKRAPRPERRAGDRGAPCTEAGGGEGGTRRQAGGGVRGGAIDRDLPDAGVQADSAACWRPRGVLEAADGRGGGRQWRPLVDGEGQCALWCILQGRRANCTAQVSWAHARAAGRTGAAARPVCNTRSPLVLRRSL